jgi:hypothetical protein
MTAFARLVFGVLAAAVLGLAILAADAGGRSAAVHCKLAGNHYWGTTSQKKPLCFTVSKDGTKLVEYSFGYRNNCGAIGTSWTRNTKRGYVAPLRNGSFKYAGFRPSFFKGVVRGSTAHGTFRDRMVGGTGTCDTGVVRWTAHRR